jgi:hypothetical protein
MKGSPAQFWSYARKAGVAALGTIAVALAMGLLPDPWDKVATAVLAVATYFGVYRVPNVVPGTGQVLPAGSESPVVNKPTPLQ